MRVKRPNNKESLDAGLVILNKYGQASSHSVGSSNSITMQIVTEQSPSTPDRRKLVGLGWEMSPVSAKVWTHIVKK